MAGLSHLRILSRLPRGFSRSQAVCLQLQRSGSSEQGQGSGKSRWARWGGLAAAGGLAAVGLWSVELRELKAATVPAGEPEPRPDLPVYRMAEVAKHKSLSAGDGRVWVVYKSGVYDVTDFLEAHPGGVEKISLALGGSVEPFWAVYTQHKSAMVLDILKDLRIGTLHPDDVKAQSASTSRSANDPYANDPERHPALLVNAAAPFNAETPPALLAHEFHTPNALFYVRNHLPVPKVDVASYRLRLEGKGLRRPVEYSLQQLQSRKFKQETISSAVQCAGNRRAGLNAAKEVKGLMWQSTAIGNATWTGVRLADVLRDAGVDESAGHVWMTGLDKDPLQGTRYETSIPMDKALGRETLLVWAMNGEPLPVDHGAPLRAIVPGVVGARQVKWLGSLTISDEESSSHWQAKDYRMFGPSATAENVDYASAPAIQEAPVQSAILSPAPGASVDLEDGKVSVSGYAWSGGGRGIVRVEVSADGGLTWTPAELTQPTGQPLRRMWAWTLWTAEMPLPSGAKKGASVTLLCKATDASYNTQPDTANGVWNFRGLLNNAWHRVPLNLK